MSSIIVLIFVFFLDLLGNSCLVEAQSVNRPNIIVIMADDLGYADVGFNGCKDIPTPNIDRLATSGARFTSAYVTAPNCGPSRAGFITGRLQSTFGWYANSDQPLDPQQGLPANIQTVAKLMQEQGYVTGMMGKWHMGTADYQDPNVLGFSEYWGFLGGSHLYYPMDDPRYHGKYLNMKKPWGIADSHNCLPILHNREPVVWHQYLTRELTDQGINFIKKNRNKSLFLFMSYNAPHLPLEAPKETIAMFSEEKMTAIPGVKPKDRAIYGAMVYELDMGVGRLMKTLDQLGLTENTIVWFLSDNGGMKRTSDNRPLRGAKWDSYEGGLRVPFVVNWPGHIKSGSVLQFPVTSLDIGATSVALAGGDLSIAGLDGSNIAGYMTGQTTKAPHQELLWRWDRKPGKKNGVCLIDGYKLIVQNGIVVALYNLKNDLSETTDLSQTEPDRVRMMLAQWKILDQSSQPPLWKSLTKKEQMKDKYQYKDYEWLKGTPYYKTNE